MAIRSGSGCSCYNEKRPRYPVACMAAAITSIARFFVATCSGNKEERPLFHRNKSQ